MIPGLSKLSLCVLKAFSQPLVAKAFTLVHGGMQYRRRLVRATIRHTMNTGTIYS